MRYIEHLIEPLKLLLSWQTSQPGKSRGRMFVAELIRKGQDADLVYLRDSEEFKQAKSLGFTEYPGFPATQQKHENVLSGFMKRLPPRTRGDFEKFLTSLRIKADAHISDFALLGYSGAKLPDDDFTVINPFEDATPPFEFLLQIQGYRYYMENLPLSKLRIEQEAIFEPEPDNESDPRAVRIITNGFCAGYVSRGLTESFHKWFSRGYAITANLERINGTEERPAIFLYVAVKDVLRP